MLQIVTVWRITRIKFQRGATREFIHVGAAVGLGNGVHRVFGVVKGIVFIAITLLRPNDHFGVGNCLRVVGIDRVTRHRYSGGN